VKIDAHRLSAALRDVSTDGSEEADNPVESSGDWRICNKLLLLRSPLEFKFNEWILVYVVLEGTSTSCKLILNAALDLQPTRIAKAAIFILHR
jgi:hypothetical protein